MNIRCTREPLLAALQSASAVVPARSPKPVLSNVKIEAGRDGAVLSATDLEVGIRTEVEGCLLYTSPSPRDGLLSRMPSSA